MSELYVGLLSGSSLDGVDAVLVDFADERIDIRGHYFVPYPADLRGKLLSLQTPARNELHRVAQLGEQMAHLNHVAVTGLLAKSRLHRDDIQAIGSQGQTVRQNVAAGFTVNVGHASVLAELSGITVVSGFRNRGLSSEGQTAPLTSAFHDALWRREDQHRVVVTLGGFAAVTDLAPGKPTFGFDAGPGNLLMDGWIQSRQGRNFDSDGAWAASGEAVHYLLNKCMAHPFIIKSPPKMCGHAEFNLNWLESLLHGTETSVDVQATLLEYTTLAIAQAVREWCGRPDEVIACGGGVRNKALMSRLGDLIPEARITPAEELGIVPEQVDAAAFAWLARQTLRCEPAKVGGNRAGRILGAIYQP